MSQRILFATYGSLGDLHPYIALALALKQRGHQPVIASFGIHRAAVEAEGIAFTALRPEIEQFGGVSDVVRRLFLSHDGPAYMVKKIFMPHIRASYEDLDSAAAHCDLIVTHPLSFAGPLIAQKRGLPWVSSILSPMSLMSCIEPPLIGPAPWMKSLRKLGVTPYRMVFNLARTIGRRWEQPLHALRAELNLPPAPPAQFEGQFSPLLNLALFSPLLATPQIDWPVNTVLCGFPHYDGAKATPELLARLQRFLDAGEPPLVFGLGSSAVMIAGDFWHHAISAAQTLGRRAILLTGATPSLPENLPPTIAAFEYLPYSAVFPHACAVIHQAGIGTFAQALAAGRPQLIVPVAFDQPDNAERAAKLGVARALPFRKVTPARLSGELKQLLGDNRYACNASEVAAKIRQEDAMLIVCERLEALLTQRGDTT